MFANEKFKKIVTNLCYALELIAALFVLVGIIITIIRLVPSVEEYWNQRMETSAFTAFLERVMALVIGVEFLKMLCRPNSDNILETIIFVVARHMIIAPMASTIDGLISAVSICLLVFMRRYLKVSRDKEQKRESAGLKDVIKDLKSE
ncbi:MAG: hypothetical protein E7241_09025 [Lachnospiraceae bacterium]|nr:hypothetical protein [Lachnospiraceae bacterium]